MDGFSANLPPYLSVRKRYRRQCGITSFYSPITHFTGRHFYQTFREAHKRFKALGLRVKVLQISFSRTQSAISVWRSMPLHCLHWEQHDWVCAVIHLKKMLDDMKIKANYLEIIDGRQEMAQVKLKWDFLISVFIYVREEKMSWVH